VLLAHGVRDDSVSAVLVVTGSWPPSKAHLSFPFTPPYMWYGVPFRLYKLVSMVTVSDKLVVRYLRTLLMDGSEGPGIQD